MRGHGRWQASAHGGQGVVQQNGVRLVRFVVTGEPDFIDAVVQGDDALGRQHAADVGNQALRVDREASVVGALGDLRFVGFADGHQAGEVPVRGVGQGFADLPDGIGNVTDHFHLGEVHGIDFGGAEADVNDFGTTTHHEEWRLLDHVVADVDDQVGGFYGAVHEVAGRQCGVTQEARVTLVDYALAHLGGDERDAGFVD